MTEAEFSAQWKRLVDNLEHGKLTQEQVAARGREAWRAFEHYKFKRFKEAISACIEDPDRKWFPTVGEIMRCLNETYVPAKIESMGPTDPVELAKLQQENADWWRDEVLPLIENRMKIESDGPIGTQDGGYEDGYEDVNEE